MVLHHLAWYNTKIK